MLGFKRLRSLDEPRLPLLICAPMQALPRRPFERLLVSTQVGVVERGCSAFQIGHYRH